MMPRGPNNYSPLLATASAPQTVVLLASIQLVGTMGPSLRREGLPPNPIIIIIAVIRASLDHKGVSVPRLQMQLEGKEEGTQNQNGHLSQVVFLATQLDVAASCRRETSPKVNVLLWVLGKVSLLSEAFRGLAG